LRPAKIIGLDHPGLVVGAPANLFLFDPPSAADQSLQIHATYVLGKR